MREKFRFELDPETGVVLAAFENLTLDTPEDALRWEEVAGELLSGLGRQQKVDLLIDLSGLHVKSRASRAFGEARARVLANWARHSARFGADDQTQAYIFTSAVIDSTDANIFTTKDEALGWILRRRRLSGN